MQAREHPATLVILGHPIAHSLSPSFQNAALIACGLPQRYEPIDVAPAALSSVLDRLALERAGGNVTIPHKEAVARRARCSPLAQRVGAVNTFWHDEGTLIGHNTDVAGIVANIESLRPEGIRGARCALLGAGGSAAAVLVALQQMGCSEIRIAARTRARAADLASRVQVSANVFTLSEKAVEGATLVINATPIGMNDESMPLAPTDLAPGAAVFDLVYRRGETAWVRASRAAGHPACDGLRMLLEQGAAAFTCWFGIPAPRDTMESALATAASVRA